METDEWPRWLNLVLGMLVVVTVILCAMVIAGSKTLADGIGGVSLLVTIGLLYSMLAVGADERGQSERESGSD